MLTFTTTRSWLGGEPSSQSTTQRHTVLSRFIHHKHWFLINSITFFVSLATLMGLLGHRGWLFDLLGQFRVQYLFVLGGLVLISRMGRQRLPMMMALFFALVNLGMLLPYWTHSAAAAPADAPTYQTLMINVGWWNEEFDAVAALIAETDADFVLLEELSPEWIEALDYVLVEYPYSNQAQREIFHNSVLYSRFPVDSFDLMKVEGVKRPFLSAQTHLDGQTVTLLGVHSISPKNSDRWAQRDLHLAGVANYAAALDGPVLLFGDLNVASWSPSFESFREVAGLENGRFGFGIQPTWPAQFPLVGIPIDHVLTSPEIAIHDLTTALSVGSDHLPVLFSFSVLTSSTK
ncbi:MAG: hypothetical protein DWQ04_01165 [Chloroflexi bacterium]|nr:MAG: hypothetical protein DWQ04_01165 [Chloroflexota bacterium]